MAPTSFEDLNDDCMKAVIDQVAKIPRPDWHKPTSLQSLSLVNKRIRYLCRPVIFTRNRLYLAARSRAKPTIQTFSALANAEFRLSTLQALSFTFNNARAGHDAAFCKSLVTALAAMPILSELHLDLYHYEDLCVRLRFASIAIHLTLPVKILCLKKAPNAAFFIQACPSLETFISVSNRKWKRTFAPLLALKTLRRLEIDARENWTARRLKDLVPYMNVPELCLKGELYKIRPSALATQFQDLSRLKSLSMTCMQWINHHAFFSYWGFDDCEEQQHIHPLYEDTDVTARAFFEDCPQLLEFQAMDSYGTSTYEFARSKEDSVDKVEFRGNKYRWVGFNSAFESAWEPHFGTPMRWEQLYL